jgi:hypothetical protein
MLLKAVLSRRQLSDAFIYAVRLHFSCLMKSLSIISLNCSDVIQNHKDEYDHRRLIMRCIKRCVLVSLLFRSLSISLWITVRLYALLWPSEHELNGNLSLSESLWKDRNVQITTYVEVLFLKFVRKSILTPPQLVYHTSSVMYRFLRCHCACWKYGLLN